MSFHYLDFEFSEDTSGTTTFDAVATVSNVHLHSLANEASAVLAWATQTFPNVRGPLDEGFDWDCALQATPALLALLPPEEQAQATECQPEYGPQGQEWHTLTLTLTGGPAFAEAFRERFGL